MYNIKMNTHKHVAAFLVNYYKLKHSMTIKNIHTSCLLQSRKPASRKTSRISNVTSHDFQSPEHLGNTNNNFYGIESDEGVIYPQKDSTQEKTNSISTNQSLQTEFRYVSFGAVRLDSENQPTYFSKSDNLKKKSEIPLTSSEVLNHVNNIDDKSYNQTYIENKQRDLEFQSQNYDLKYNKEPIICKPTVINDVEKEVNNKISSDKPSGSYIDDLYFSDSELTKSPETINAFDFPPQNSNENKPITMMNPHSPNLDVNQHEYELNNSRNISLSENVKYDNTRNVQQNMSKESFMQDPIQKILKTKEITAPYIDQYSFKEEIDEQSTMQNILKSKEIHPSYIDEYYFEEVVENPVVNSKIKDSSFVDQQYFDGKDLEINKADLVPENHNFNEQIFFDKSSELKSSNENSNERNTLKQSDFKFNAKSLLPKINHDNLNEQIIINKKDISIESKEDINMKPLTKSEININQNLIQIKESKISKKSEISHSELERNKFSDIKSLTSTNLENKSIRRDSNMLNLKKVINKPKSFEIINQNKLISSTNQDEKKSETAYDFVQKLNEKQYMSDLIKKGISAKKEKKVDSKGFRILKHQVPSLMYFSRDEMLELLQDSILYSDGDIVVLNKPYNLVIHESRTTKDNACLSMYLDDLAKLLDQTTNDPRLLTIHRLDKETTGCLILARNELAAQNMKALFSQRKIIKTYWIVTTKVPDPPEGIIDIPISEGKIEKKTRMVLHPNLPDDINYVNHSKAGKRAVTRYSTITTSGNAALVEVKPETGLKHQIRVHFGFGLACPILGDHKYSHLDKMAPQKLSSDLLQRLHVRQSKVRHIPLHIHAKHVLIPQYSEGKNLFVSAPLPKHMVENLRSLKFKKRS